MTLLMLVAALLWGCCVLLLLRAVQHPSLVQNVKRLVLAGVFGGAASLMTGLLILANVYLAFAGESLVAEVSIARRGRDRFELTYSPAMQGMGGTRYFELGGDQWSVSGGIVKWHPWLTAIGLKSYHKPMRVSGQYSNLDAQQSHYPTIYPLQGRSDWFWNVLYALDPYLPFIDAAFGSAAYANAEPGPTYEVYVTPSGYIIKRRAQPQRAG